MSTKLHVLLIEDSENDAALVIRNLEKADFAVEAERIETAEQLRKALQEEEWDLILADYSLPQFNAPKALEFLREVGLDIPFIVISGTIGETAAIALLKAGAHDCLQKDNLGRLGPVVSRELAEARIRQARRDAESSLRESEERYRELYEQSPMGYQSLDAHGNIITVNQVWLDKLGYSRQEVVGKWFGDFLTSDCKSNFQRNFESFVVLGKTHGEIAMVRKDKTLIYVMIEGRIGHDRNGEFKQTHCIIHDITERKRMEENLRVVSERLSMATQGAGVGIWDLDLINDRMVWNQTMFYLYGVTPENFSSNYSSWRKMVHPEDLSKAEKNYNLAIEGLQEYDTEFRIVRPDGIVRYIKANGKVKRDSDGKPVRMLGTNWDITSQKQAEEDLFRSRQMLQLILDNIPQRVFCKDLDCRYLWSNRAFAADAGLANPEDIIGREDYDLSWQDAAELYREDDRKTMTTGVAKLNFIEQMPSGDGAFSWLETSKIPLRDHEGNVFGVMGVYENITSRKQSEERRQFSNRVLSLLNRHSGRADIIRELLGLFKNFSEIEAVGIRLRDGQDFPYYITTGFPERFIEKERSLVSAPAANQDMHDSQLLECICGMVIQSRIDKSLPLFSPAGSFWCNSLSDHLDHLGRLETHCMRQSCVFQGYESMALIPLRFGTEIIGLLQFNDHRRNRFTLDQVEFLEEIGASVGIALHRLQMEEELQVAKSNAESANRAKSEFLATISHEIRTPLNGILGFASVLSEELLENANYNPGVVKDSLAIINQCGETLLGIINDVLELSRIEAGQFNTVKEAFSPEKLIVGCIDAFKFRAKKKGIELHYKADNLPRQVIGDQRRLKQIIFNLVGNAVKFTDKGNITAAVESHDGKLILAISDTGIGIPKDQLQKIMQPFYQVDQSAMRKQGGTGLGLTIVARMLEKLDGTIDIQSVPGKGTTVTFTYPVEVSDAPETAVTPRSASAVTPKRDLCILAVEDDAVTVMYLNNILGKITGNYQIAESFNAMKSVCEKGMKPDLVLLDIALPDMDGIGCLKWLQQYYSEHKVRYIAQTAHVLADQTERYRQEGFDDIIRKPYLKKELIDVILKNV